MPLDIAMARRQMVELEWQAANLAQAGRELEDYRRKLDRAWTGREVTYLDQTADSLRTRCVKLEKTLTALRRDMERAVEEILEEESAGEDA